jgi:hypothetical protein
LVLGVACGGRTEAARRPPPIDPIGTWRCVLYGHPDFGDERVLLHFAASGAVQLARLRNQKTSVWNGLTGWVVDDDELRFSDPQTGRLFTAELRNTTLGGGWRTRTDVGGWWCSAVDDAVAPVEQLIELPHVLPLVPALTATPRYPIQAVRDAKQGRVVACFFVDAEGMIRQPEIIELSDEVFRAPTLAALQRSRYQGWKDDGTLRPGCRSYIFKLDSRLGELAEPES